MRHPPVLLRPANAAATAAEDSASSTASYPTVSSSASAPTTSGISSSYSSTGGGGGGGSVAFGSTSTATHGPAVCPPSGTSSTTANGHHHAGPNSSFSGSVPSLVGPLLPSARRYVAVRLLTGETLQFDVEVRSMTRRAWIGRASLTSFVLFLPFPGQEQREGVVRGRVPSHVLAGHEEQRSLWSRHTSR